MKLIFTYSDLKQQSVYFDNREEYEYTQDLFRNVNSIKNRKLALLVNPVSGKRLGRKYNRDILTPILNVIGIEYDEFLTNSSTYVEEWVRQYDSELFPYTDIICVGGDGLFSQLINSMGKSPKKEELMKTPIGLLP